LAEPCGNGEESSRSSGLSGLESGPIDQDAVVDSGLGDSGESAGGSAEEKAGTALTGSDKGLNLVDCAAQDEGLGALFGTEIDVARAESEPIRIADDGADDDLRRETKVGDHTADHGDLGCVFLAEEGAIGFGGDEQLGDDGCNAAEVTWTRCSVETVAEIADFYEGCRA